MMSLINRRMRGEVDALQCFSWRPGSRCIGDHAHYGPHSDGHDTWRDEAPREVNTQNHQRVNAEAMKRAYADADVEVPPSTIEHLESLRARAIEEAGISKVEQVERDYRVPIRSIGTQPPKVTWKYNIGVDWGLDQCPPPMERKPAPKCPPSCTPVEPCKRVECEAERYLAAERLYAKLMKQEDRAFHPKPQPPRPEARRIGAADLSFGRWNGRVPR